LFKNLNFKEVQNQIGDFERTQHIEGNIIKILERQILEEYLRVKNEQHEQIINRLLLTSNEYEKY
jgi:hypothetical protein